MSNGHFLGGAAEGIQQVRELDARKDIASRSLNLQERGQADAKQRALLQDVDKQIENTMSIAAKTIEAGLTAGRDRELIRKAVTPLLSDIQGLGARVGRDPSTYAKQLDALIQMPTAPKEPAPGSPLGKLHKDLESGFISQEQYDAAAQRLTEPTQGINAVETIRRKIASGQPLAAGEQTVYDDALRSDPLARLMLGLAGGPMRSDAPTTSAPPPRATAAPRPAPAAKEPRDFKSEAEIEAALQANEIKIGDVIVLNGKRVRVDQ